MAIDTKTNVASHIIKGDKIITYTIYQSNNNINNNNNNNHYTTVFAMAAGLVTSAISFSCVVRITSQSRIDVSFSIHNTLSICDWLYVFSDSMTFASLRVLDMLLVVAGGSVAVIAGFILLASSIAMLWRFQLFRVPIFNTVLYIYMNNWLIEYTSDVHDANAHRLKSIINLFIW